MGEQEIEFWSVDGVRLRGTLANVPRARANVVLVHGAGADREEDGVFSRLGERLAAVYVRSLRFDLRGHGESAGGREQTTVLSTVNDIQAAVDLFSKREASMPVHVIASSFSGGAAAYFAARSHVRLASLILINPVLSYRAQYLDGKPYWDGSRLNEVGRRVVDQGGWIDYRGVLKITSRFVAELPWIDPMEIASELKLPVLAFHGTEDQRVPYHRSREWIACTPFGKLVLVKGADHEITIPGDSLHEQRQTREWHEMLFNKAIDWILNHSNNV